jgi:hypothetical protein
VSGSWTTQQYTAQGDVALPVLGINAKGDAVVAWSNVNDAKCSTDSSKVCPRVFAYRF